MTLSQVGEEPIDVDLVLADEVSLGLLEQKSRRLVDLARHEIEALHQQVLLPLQQEVLQRHDGHEQDDHHDGEGGS